MNDTAPITLTESAAHRIVELIAQEKTPGARLRVAVSGGGCSGFALGFSFDEAIADGDLVITRDGASAVVDSLSLMYLAGSEIDFVNEVEGSYFTVKNPNATASCGCGASFSVAF